MLSSSSVRHSASRGLLWHFTSHSASPCSFYPANAKANAPTPSKKQPKTSQSISDAYDRRQLMHPYNIWYHMLMHLPWMTIMHFDHTLTMRCYFQTRNTFCGIWYLSHSRHNGILKFYFWFSIVFHSLPACQILWKSLQYWTLLIGCNVTPYTSPYKILL